LNSKLARVAWGLTALMVGALLVLHSSDPDGPIGDVTYLIAVVGAPVVAAVAVWRRRTDRMVGALVTLALATSAAADVVWQVQESVTGVAPDISVADVGYVVAYPLLGWALLVLVRRSDYRLRRDPDSLIDMSVAAVLVALAVWMLWVSPTLADTTTPLFVRSVWALYPVLDATLLALLARMLLHRTVRGPAVALLACGLGLWLLADAGYVALASWPWAEATMNMGWMLGSVLMAAAVWTFKDVDARTVARRRSVELARPVRRWRIVLAVVPLALPWCIELWAFSRGWDVDPVPLVIASVALAGLVCARTLHLLRMQRDTEQLYRAAAEHSSDATLIVSRDGLLLQDAPGLRALLRDEQAGAAGTSMAELAALTPGGRVWLDDVVGRVLERPGAVVEHEVRIRTGEDGDAWLFVRVVNLLDSPGVNAVLVNLHDITDRKAVEAALEHQAFHDPLTGLPNRALFADRLHHAFDQQTRTGLEPAVLFLDLDHFKSVNDRLGHDAGDELLTEVARRLRSAVRSGDSLARLGGDEFAVLIEHSRDPLRDAQDVAERILRHLAAPVALDHTHLTVTASIGIAPGSAASGPTALLRDADIAMYHAKAAGRGRAVVYSSEMREADELRLRVEVDLPNAIAAQQMRVEYQPVVDLASGDVTGFEALLRWTHPTYGEVSPEVFIPIAEQSGAIHEIGAWVLSTACTQLGSWQRDLGTELTVAVNLSGRQLADPRLPGVVVRALQTNGLTAEHLVLEITETALIGDTDEANSLLAPLRQLGVRFAIDDFGTGYSSLSYLQHLPIDILKIDRSFVSEINAGRKLPDIVRGLLDLAHTLHLRTIAEGIEHPAQQDQLRAAGCDEGQGFLFARSLSASAATTLLHERGLTGTPLASR